MKKKSLIDYFLLLFLFLITFIAPLGHLVPSDNGFADPIHLSSNKISSESFTSGEKVLLQGFFWEVPDDGNWWNMMKNEAPYLKDAGFDSIWLPPPQKTKVGKPGEYGYEPYDYYDLGEFDQKSRIRTLYGTRSELELLIDEFHANDLYAIADIVINHCVGGDEEWNLDTSSFTNTNFMNVSSGKFLRNYTHFHSNIGADRDNYAFGNFPDFNHSNQYVHDEFIKWGIWLRDEIGYDGWRFDVALGTIPEMLRDWMNNISGYGIAEYWSGLDMTVSEQTNYLDGTNNTVSSFDFLLLRELRRMCLPSISYDMQDIVDAGLLGSRKSQAVTFVTNHDTFRQQEWAIPEEYRLIGYAFIMTHEGYPMVYIDDYLNLKMHQELKFLIKIHNEYAKGNTSLIYVDEDLYIMQRDGNPGLLLVINENGGMEKTVTIDNIKWVNTTLYDALGRSDDIHIDSSGSTTFSVPSYSYAIYSSATPIQNATEDDETNVVMKIPKNSIKIDGRLDSLWTDSISEDSLGDSGSSAKDFEYLYLNTDETYLYVGFSVGTKNLWTLGDLDYGIAIDTKTGGERSDPGLHQNVTWAGNAIPDYMYYFSTDSELSSHNLHNGSFFKVKDGEDWEFIKTVDTSDFATNKLFGFSEIRILLSEIELEQGGTFSLKVFSSPKGKSGATDTVPHDAEVDVDGDGITWLSLLDSFEILPIEAEIIPPVIPGYNIIFVFLGGLISTVVTITRSIVSNKKKGDIEPDFFH